MVTKVKSNMVTHKKSDNSITGLSELLNTLILDKVTFTSTEDFADGVTTLGTLSDTDVLALQTAGTPIETIGFYPGSTTGSAKYKFLNAADSAAAGYVDGYSRFQIRSLDVYACLANVSVISIAQLGAKFDDTGNNSVQINHAISLLAAKTNPVGIVDLGIGNIRCDDKISCNHSGIRVVGHGTDITALRFTNTNSLKTGFEINNGSWDENTLVYTSGGTSIGSSTLELCSVISVSSTNSTGVVFARATKQCKLSNVKIVGWDVPFRFYGAWYSKIDTCSIEGNVNGGRFGYETNNVTISDTDFASNSNSHVDFESTGTCRGINFRSCAFDGLPTLFGIYLKNVTTVCFTNSTYFEIYNGDPTTPPVLQCGANVVNLQIDGVDMIYPSDNSYVGDGFKFGVGAGVGVIGASISNFRQYNSATGNALTCTDGAEIEVGENVRVSSSVVGNIGTEILASSQESVVIPETTTTDEHTILVGYTKRPFDNPINFTAYFEGAASFAGQKIRIIRDDTSAVVLEYTLTSSVSAGDIIDIGNVTGIAQNVALLAYTYKVGSSITWPNTVITMRQI